MTRNKVETVSDEIASVLHDEMGDESYRIGVEATVAIARWHLRDVRRARGRTAKLRTRIIDHLKRTSMDRISKPCLCRTCLRCRKEFEDVVIDPPKRKRGGR